MRIAMAVWLGLALFLVGLSAGWADDRDQATMIVRVTASDHEVDEGYFSLGDSTTIVTKSGTELHRFLSRQRGRKVKITITEDAGRELSRLER